MKTADLQACRLARHCHATKYDSALTSGHGNQLGTHIVFGLSERAQFGTKGSVMVKDVSVRQGFMYMSDCGLTKDLEMKSLPPMSSPD